MEKKSRLELLWPWIELLVSALLGLLLYFPLKRSDLAEIAWLVGFLLAFGGLATTVRLKQELDAVRKVSEVIDISTKCKVQKIAELMNLYLIIGEEEFRKLKDDVLDDSISNLTKLAYDKISDEIHGSEYYRWLIETMRGWRKGEEVCAVSVMLESEWVDIPQERLFLEECIAAAKKGASIQRIFLSSKERLRDKRNRLAIQKHVEHANYGLIAFVAWADDIEVREPDLIKEIGKGFIQFGHRVVLIDNSVPPQETRGQVSINVNHLRHYRRLFDRLKLHARVVDLSFFEELANSPDKGKAA